ncbi:MAG: hypothetical protein ACP5XB_28420, partial [Isosphaeraceae bacterium]
MPSQALPLHVLEQINQIRETFEAAWNAGQQPRIEDYLSLADFDYRSALLHELLGREVELRRLAGDAPEAADYEHRFAGHGELIRTVLDQTERRDETAINDVPPTDAEPGAQPRVADVPATDAEPGTQPRVDVDDPATASPAPSTALGT